MKNYYYLQSVGIQPKRRINMKLLFAEDEVSMAEAVTDILTYHNYSVDTVYDGADALD